MSPRVCPVCRKAIKPWGTGRPRVIHSGCRGRYEAERRRVRRARMEAVEAIDLAAQLLGEAGVPSAVALLTRAARLVNEAPMFLSAAARRRWFAADHPELPPSYVAGVSSWTEGGDSGGGAEDAAR